MKIGLITDTHLNEANEELVEDIFDQFLVFCQTQGIKTAFHGGDFFTSRKGQTLRRLKAAERIFEKLGRHLKLYIIPGNHDKTNQESESSYLDVFRFFPGVNVVNEPRIIEIDGCGIALLPYFPEAGSYYPRLQKLTEEAGKLGNKSNFLITHIAVDGVVNKGHKVQNSLKSTLFSFYDKVFVGHYHDRQKLGNVKYIGSSYQDNFGEDPMKGFTVLDLKTKQTFFKRSSFKEYKTFEVPAAEVGSFVMPDNADCFTRIKIVGSRADLKSVEIPKELAKDNKIIKVPDFEQAVQASKSTGNFKTDFIMFSREAGLDKSVVSLILKTIKECGI